MTDYSTKQEPNVGDIAQELRAGRLSRGGLIDRLKGLGIGFGAAFVLGISGANATSATQAEAVVKSSNPVLNSIIQEGLQLPVAEAPALQKVSYYRWFRRFFRRW